jgi:hypothetical protein
MTPREQLQQAMIDFGIVVESEFVPWSKSRSFKPDADADVRKRSLNWRVRIVKTRTAIPLGAPFEILTTDYTAGIAHAPSYKIGHLLTVDVAKALERETETGLFRSKRIEPDACDVMFSLVSESDAIDYATFEEWASNLGYDTDSRKAEATYRACLDTALKLRAALGEAGLERLRHACQDY